MRNTLLTKSTLALTLFLAVVVFAVGSFAYNEPIASWPTNTIEPIDTGMANQAKVGPLSVFAFFARGNADFKKDLTIEGVAQGGNPGDTTSAVQIASNVLTTGDIYAGDPTARNPVGHLQANSLKHNESAPKTVCGDENGIVVFCMDVCPNIDGEQPSVPSGQMIDSAGNCVPVPDLCSNIDGIQAGPLDPNHLSIEDPAQPTFCTQTIRGTIWAGIHGPVVVNMANNAMLAQLYIKEIKITSIGGNTTINRWPTGIEPLKFNWGVCSKWNSAYIGPNLFNSSLGGSPNDAYPNAASIAEGVCFNFRPDFAHRSALTYGTWKYDSTNGPYTAWDGVNGMTPFWFDDAGTRRWIEDPAGFFDAERYEATGSKTNRVSPYGALEFFIRKNFTTAEYANIKLPVEKLILSNVKVPTGYKLILTTDPVKSPGTIVEIYKAP